MKKAIWAFVAALLLAGSASAAGMRVELKGSLFSSENAVFRDVYGSGVKLGLEAGKDVAKNVSVWVGIDRLQRSGEMTETKETVKVRLTPLSVGVRYEMPAAGKLRFHVAAGIQEVFFREEAPLGVVKENALGIMARAGGMFRLTDKVGAGLFLAWSTCHMTHEDVKFKVGGLDIGAGVEFRF